MAEKIVIASLDLDVDALIKSTSDVKKVIDQLKNAQKELAKQGDTNSEQFVQNVADLKVLNSAYNSNLKAISDSVNAKAEETNRTALLSLALQAEATSIKEAREQNSLLNKLRNETNVTTEEGRAEIEALNKKLDENNALIKENADAYLKQKINIGNYKDSIKDALNELNPLNGGLTGFIARSKEAGGVGNLVKTSLSGVAQGFLGITKASLAFIATPIGAVLAAIVLAFTLVKNAMNRSEESTNKISKLFSVFSGILNKFLKVLEPLGDFIINYIVGYFEALGKAASFALDVISSGLELLGFDDAAKSVKGFQEEMAKTIKEAQKLADAEAELEKAQRASQKTQLEYQKNAEKLRQIRDDETKTFQERISANEELGKVLKDQLRDELKIAELSLSVANQRIKSEGATKENLDKQAEALTTIADIQERITGQESEQLVNRNSLQKEYAQKVAETNQKNLDNAVAISKAQLDLFISEQGIKAKSLEEGLKLAEQIAQKQIAINQKVFDASKKTEADKLALQTANNEVRNTLLQTQADAVIANVDRELQIFKDANKTQLDDKKFLTEELANEEINRLNRIAEEEAEAQTQRLINGQITEAQYQDAIKAIDEKFYQDKLAIEEQRKVAEAQRKAIDLENTIIEETETFRQQLEGQTQNLNAQREQELKDAEKTGADRAKINAKYDKAILDARTASKNAELALTANVLGQIAGLLKENTVLAKALSIAEATINTYLGATKALATLPPPFGAIQAGITIATGLGQVAKISGVKFEDGGIMEVGGNRHAQGGTKFVGSDGTRFEAEKGELIGVLNRSASRQFMSFNDAFGRKGSVGTNYAQNGGIIARGMGDSTADLQQLALLTADAVSQIPAPIVTVEDINSVATRVNVIESGASF